VALNHIKVFRAQVSLTTSVFLKYPMQGFLQLTT
jgi:hypothetical protein